MKGSNDFHVPVTLEKEVGPGSDVSVLGSNGSSSIFHHPIDQGSSVSAAISLEGSANLLQGSEGSVSVHQVYVSVPLSSKVTHPSGSVAPCPVSGLVSDVSQVCKVSGSVHPGLGFVDHNLLPTTMGSSLSSGSVSATVLDVVGSVQGSQGTSAIGVAEGSLIPQQHSVTYACTQQVSAKGVVEPSCKSYLRRSSRSHLCRNTS